MTKQLRKIDDDLSYFTVSMYKDLFDGYIVAAKESNEKIKVSLYEGTEEKAIQSYDEIVLGLLDSGYWKVHSVSESKYSRYTILQPSEKLVDLSKQSYGIVNK